MPKTKTYGNPPTTFRLSQPILNDLDWLVEIANEDTGVEKSRADVIRVLVRQEATRLRKKLGIIPD